MANESDDLDDTDDGLPDTLSEEGMTDRRYMGGHIPSRSFRALQMSIGDSPQEPTQPTQPTPVARKGTDNNLAYQCMQIWSMRYFRVVFSVFFKI